MGKVDLYSQLPSKIRRDLDGASSCGDKVSVDARGVSRVDFLACRSWLLKLKPNRERKKKVETPRQNKIYSGFFGAAQAARLSRTAERRRRPPLHPHGCRVSDFQVNMGSFG